MIRFEDEAARARRRGFAMIPTLLVVAGLAVFALGLSLAVTDGQRTSVQQADDYRLSSSVESVAMLAAERIWSGYLQEEGGAAGTIWSFRSYLTSIGIPPMTLPDGGTPGIADGKSLLEEVALPEIAGGAQFHDTQVDALQVFRRDVGESTQIYLTVSATTTRGAGLLADPLDRAVQQVYTVEPEQFEGFDFAVLANNVNCIFCHTQVDSVERVFNHDETLAGTFDKVKVGTLESLMLRDWAGVHGNIGDFDADSFVAGSLYVRGAATDQDGTPLTDWDDLAFQSYAFDPATGKIDETFGLSNEPFSPAGDPPQPGENLYLDYAEAYADMVDGKLPLGFPAPIPDDGGVDPATGLPDPAGADNKVIDDNEFYAAKETAQGSISGGIMSVVPPGETIDDVEEYFDAALEIDPGDPAGLQDVVEGNLILTGTEENPILISGTLAVDGDMIISGYVKGDGTLIVRGNVYVPTDLEYLDGQAYLPGDLPGLPTGPRTFGVAADGTKNALGLASGGNVLVGDYLAPATLQADLSKVLPEKYEIVDGTFDPSAPEESGWNFALAEMSLFNRGEWAKTQAQLPGPNGSLVPNPGYEAGYVPRYYHFGEDDAVPIYNQGGLYFDPDTGTWHGDAEVPVAWDPALLTIADPNDPGDPYLHPAGGLEPVLLEITPQGGWLPDDLYKASIEHFEDTRPLGKAFSIDGLLYTNNAIFSIVNRSAPTFGRMNVNGSLVCADLGMLVPGIWDPWGIFPNQSPLSDYAIGLQLNYDERVKDMLNVQNPMQVQLKRTLWNPTANLMP